MTHRYGVRYPNGTWSGPISPTAKDLKPYARQHHGTIYEVGSADDPCPRGRPEAVAWNDGFGVLPAPTFEKWTCNEDCCSSETNRK